MSDEVDVGSEIDALFDKVDKLPPELQMVSELSLIHISEPTRPY